MKAYFVLVPLSIALLGGCTVVRQPVAYTAPAATVAVAPSYVAPTYVTPSYTVITP